MLSSNKSNRGAFLIEEPELVGESFIVTQKGLFSLFFRGKISTLKGFSPENFISVISYIKSGESLVLLNWMKL